MTSLSLGGDDDPASGHSWTHADASALASLTLLRDLEFHGCVLPTPGAAAALSSLRCLEHLNARGDVIDDGVVAAWSTGLAHLTALELESWSVGDAGAGALAAMTQLRCLIHRSGGINKAGTEALTARTNLVDLIVNGRFARGNGKAVQPVRRQRARE